MENVTEKGYLCYASSYDIFEDECQSELQGDGDEDIKWVKIRFNNYFRYLQIHFHKENLMK